MGANKMYNSSNEEQSYRKLKYSYNPQLTFDLTKADGGKITEGWILSEINWNEKDLVDLVKTVSYLPSKLKDGQKLKENVEEVYFLSLDFDKNDPALEQFKDNWKQYSSSPGFFIQQLIIKKQLVMKVRTLKQLISLELLFHLSRTISLKELDAMEEFWIEKFPSIDKTCFDGNRYFKMNPDAITHLHNYTDLEGNVVFLNPDDEQLKIKKKKPGRPKKEEITISLDDEVTLEDGSTRIKVRDISGKTKIFCPYCDHSKRTHPHTT